ncbi:cupin domain-containing protein [Streptacidiphilus sp. P02-A3a]|uniref:cupin domain-containing protein n=1 Tax=Streptacidiphilus sp. P02-A3a TaxID=2704468 RepID=UPI0015F9A0C2|nr:cupin domain-containing protein [Streptacidiphilus sp. P02-A3a]QMU71604.1 cupin domain-containing protein [Streptacidiphilus sp. P02-A3a]
MTAGRGSHLPYPEFKRRYEPAEPEPVHWQWREVAGRLGAVEHPERGTLALTLPDGSAEVLRDIAVAYQVVPAGRHTAPHAHSWYHLFVVQSGTGAITFHRAGGTTRSGLGPGDVQLVPAWCPHGFSNSGEEDLVLLNVMNIPLLARLGAADVKLSPEVG